MKLSFNLHKLLNRQGNSMKFITLIFTLLLSTQAFAHAGHGMEDNIMHLAFHAVFWTLLAGLIYKLVSHFKAKKSLKK